MGSANRQPRLPPIPLDRHVSVMPFGEATDFILSGRGRMRPELVAFLHTPTWPEERGEREDGDITTCVWLRAVWPDKAETLGFVPVCDAEAIAARYPKAAKWLSHLRHITPLGRRDKRLY